MSRNCLKVLGLMMLLIVQGCAIGYDSILFATKSNMGVDLDTAPPNLEVAISRQEGVIEPVFEGGQTVPVMASFASKSNAFTKFFWGASSTFATGEAAYTMTRLYDSPDAKDPAEAYKRVKLTKEPSAKSWFGTEKTEYIKIGGDTVRPVLFGTDTSLGIKIKWSGATAQYPSAVNIGFNRKEAAIAPLSLADLGGNKYEIDVPSLLATIDTDVSTAGSAELSYLQYFATGTAANNLTRQPAVREAMLKRADPGQKFEIYNKNVSEQEKEIATALKCYSALKQSDLEPVWRDAASKNLYFDAESLNKMLAWQKTAKEQPEKAEELLRKAHKRYVTELSTTEGTTADRTQALKDHGKIACMNAKE